jgi:DNA adenine methylase
MGSKNRIAKEIIPVMMESYVDGMLYIEPFVGGGNMIDKFPVDNQLKRGYDLDENTISALISIRDFLGELPKNNKEFTENDYANLRNDLSVNHRGYLGYACSYGGKWLAGWCRDGEGRRDYVSESYRNAVDQSTKLKGIHLENFSFDQILLPEQSSLIYCDPPYRDTTKYSKSFDHDKFYDWCRSVSKLGHVIFVSEYWMPDDFKEVWSKTVNSSLTKDTGSKKAVEKLFKLGD